MRARAYVLACGGLENPRLLLASNRQVNAGLGNQRDWVGRCFMEHPHCNAARALVADPALLSFYTYGQGGGHAAGDRGGRLPQPEPGPAARRSSS